MAGFLVDSCVLLDLFTDDSVWADWSENILDKCSRKDTLYINSIIYAEVSVGFNKIEEVEFALEQLGVEWLDLVLSGWRFHAKHSFWRARRF